MKCLLSTDQNILNAVKWSEGIDEIFKKNMENDHEILWQYFGSQTGYMRFYPGM